MLGIIAEDRPVYPIHWSSVVGQVDAMAWYAEVLFFSWSFKNRTTQSPTQYRRAFSGR